MQGLSCFGVIIPNREVKFICLPCLVLLALLFFSLFCLFSWGQQIFSGDYFILVKYFSFFAFRILYRITSYPYHIIYLASISSYVFLFLCLKRMPSLLNPLSTENLLYSQNNTPNYIPLSLRSFVLLSKKEYKNNVTKNDSVTRQTINLPISLFLLLFFLVLENRVVFRIFVSELIF